MSKNIKFLVALSEIRDYLRDANDGVIPKKLVDDFNMLAKHFGVTYDDWCKKENI